MHHKADSLILTEVFMGLSSEAPRVSPGQGGGFTTLDCPKCREFAIQLFLGVGEFSISVINPIHARGSLETPQRFLSITLGALELTL